jgi:hypothetical protein
MTTSAPVRDHQVDLDALRASHEQQGRWRAALDLVACRAHASERGGASARTTRAGVKRGLTLATVAARTVMLSHSTLYSSFSPSMSSNRPLRVMPCTGTGAMPAAGATAMLDFDFLTKFESSTSLLVCPPEGHSTATLRTWTACFAHNTGASDPAHPQRARRHNSGTGAAGQRYGGKQACSTSWMGCRGVACAAWRSKSVDRCCRKEGEGTAASTHLM